MKTEAYEMITQEHNRRAEDQINNKTSYFALTFYAVLLLTIISVVIGVALSFSVNTTDIQKDS
jgi:ABC-type proline/glycine betaine transport system permease subunit